MPASARAYYSASHIPARPPCLLVVDDDRVVRAMLSEMLQRQGYTVMEAQHGMEALNMLVGHSARIDAVVLDREMPGMTGLEVVSQMKGDPQLASIPVIMLTGTGEAERIQEGIDAGVYYYLVKPVEDTLLKSVIESALRERRQKLALISQLSHHEAAFRAMHGCQLAIASLEEAEDTAAFLASCFPDPERVVTGLMELLVNAVEHGNLQITYEEKHQFLADNTWREELMRRAALPENAGKRAQVLYQRKDGSHLVQITDCGQGFDWKRYWHINPARATASHGRGIARARLMAFDRLAYNEAGNQVTVMVSETPVPAESYAW